VSLGFVRRCSELFVAWSLFVSGVVLGIVEARLECC
jgi:hypothetical protein